MGKFSDYVGSIKQQTELLRTNLTQATGQDCSGKSIAQCAGVVSDYISESEVSEDAYVRPSWYPDIEDIITNAPDITVSGTTYYPLYIMLLANYEETSPFYTSNSTTSTARNYNRGTGGNAVLCSDDCNKDIANASAETLQVGSTIEHTWDVTKDYTDPTGESGYNVRWVIIYKTSTTTNTDAHINGACPVVEFVARQGKYYYLASGANYTTKTIDILKYYKLMPGVDLSSWASNNTSASNLLSNRYQLKTVILNDSLTVFGGYSMLNYCTNLTKLILPKNYSITSQAASEFLNNSGLKTLDLSGCSSIEGPLGGDSSHRETIIFGDNLTSLPQFSGQYNKYVKHVYLPSNLSSITNSLFNGIYMRGLKYVKIPPSVTTWTASSFNTTPYIELWNDFNLSGVSFTGNTTSETKDLKWFKDLCVWLKDRTGDTANTMILGTANLSIMNNIYLTYNPSDINDITFDGVTSSTEGAMSIVDYISNVKNWTLS